MEFTRYQLDRIARFAEASETIHQNRLLMLTPGMTQPTLAMAMRAKKPPRISEPSLKEAMEAFTALTAYRDRLSRINRLIPIGLAVTAVLGAFVWGRFGPAMAISIVIGLVLVIGVVRAGFGYLALRPIMQRFSLTDEEATFALNEIIGTARWEADR